jgi:hypothetical protein
VPIYFYERTSARLSRLFTHTTTNISPAFEILNGCPNVGKGHASNSKKKSTTDTLSYYWKKINESYFTVRDHYTGCVKIREFRIQSVVGDHFSSPNMEKNRNISLKVHSFSIYCY